MLIEFSVENVLSFGEPRTFSFVAGPMKEHQDTHVFRYAYPDDSRAKDIPLLKSAVVYGANASGKSNLINAMSFMKTFIRNSSRETQISENISVRPFRLNIDIRNKPSYFEIIFIQDGIRFRYGFRVDHNKVQNEWLYHAPKGKEAYLFERENNDIKVNRLFREGRGLEEKTRPNALFLSVCAQFNGHISTKIIEWFDNLLIIRGLGDDLYIFKTLELLEFPDYKTKVMEFIEVADLGISDLILKERKIPEDFEDLLTEFMNKVITKSGRSSEVSIVEIIDKTRKDLSVTHNVFNDDHQLSGKVDFNYSDESDGTIKMIYLAAPILYTLQKGTILIIDELDARLHPLLTKFIVNLFNSNKHNPNNAQLLFTTHDTNLLSNKIFRRDQIWFTEKNRYGVSDIYSLADFKPVRKDASFEKDYIQGKYGAIPFIGELDALSSDSVHDG